MNFARHANRLVAVLLTAGACFAADTKPQYFTHVRDIQISKPQTTNYVVVDPELWSHTRPDLGDLRLYNNGQPLPYALREQGSSEIVERRSVKVLNKGTAAGATVFLVDMSGVDVYDEISLDINQHDFDRLATVEGANSAASNTWTKLATGPIFDFTKQRLGQNLTLAFPESNFRFLRISIPSGGADRGNPVAAEHIVGAKASNTLRNSAVWDDVPTSVQRDEKAHEVVLSFEIPEGVPIDRLRFTVPADQINFRRPVRVEIQSEAKPDGSKEELWLSVTNAAISRVRSLGGKIYDSLEISTHGTRAAHWRVTIENGDDPPLPVQLHAETIERRIYFDPHGASTLKLFYGDKESGSPVYDYDKFFRPPSEAAIATLAPGASNPDFTARPDERPWSERHPWVLWAAMIVAILGIGSMALRGLKKA